MNSRASTHASSVPKYAQVAAVIRAQIADGVLLPGESLPSGAELARATGYSALTCRKGVNTLIRSGALVPGASPRARPCVPARAAATGDQTRASAALVLSADLAARRCVAGLTQPQLAKIVGMSVTTIGHAETGRLWQSRRFWEHADKGLSAGGALLALHDDYRTADIASPPAETEDAGAGTVADVPETITVAASGPVTCVTITWANGAVTTVYPPGSTPARGLAGPCPPSGSRADSSSVLDDPVEVTSDDR